MSTLSLPTESASPTRKWLKPPAQASSDEPWASPTKQVFANGFRAKVTEYLPPDVNAAFKILQAYDKKQAFREKSEVTSAFSLADLIAMSWEQREAEKAAAEAGKLFEGDAQKVEK